MKRFCAMFFLMMVLLSGSVLANGNPTPLQMFYSVKKVFPAVKQVNIFIETDQVAVSKEKIARAAAQNQLKAVIYPIATPADINKALKSVSNNGVVILFHSKLFEADNTRLFILKKCKEKHLRLVTSSADYTKSGALVGILPTPDHKMGIVVNLKHSPEYRGQFTDSFIQQAGIAEVIQ